MNPTPDPNRWERLRDMPLAEEALRHVESVDDPLGAVLICAGCYDDWPCDFERGRRSAQPAPALDVTRLREAIQFDAIPTLLIFADNNSGVQAVIAKLRAALAEPQP